MATVTCNYSAELENIFRYNYEKLYAFSYRMTGKHEDAEDVLQNSFIKAFRSIQNFKGDSSLHTWLYRIIVNESYRNFEFTKKLPLQFMTEKRGISEKQFFDEIHYEKKIDDEIIIEDLREKCLFAFLRCVPKNQRVCFLLRSFLELSYEEIAFVMGISIASVKVSLHRGRKRLQELFHFRCNLIDPEKPCKCYLWIKYMRDNNRPIPTGYAQYKNEMLKSQHFKSMRSLQKIDFLFSVKAVISREEFLRRLSGLKDKL